jgi:methylenetetrahydrofolate--tRNA-(uracil-5-)-methyltransferase
VGFQNHLKFGEQARVLRLIPGLENAKFLRYGQIHRNTYINAPTLLTPLMNLRHYANVFFAGQISGVEGYTESIAMGMLVGMHASRIAQGLPAIAPPRDTALGSLVHYLCHAESKSFQPANITFDLLPQLDEATRRRIRDKKLRHKMVCDQALHAASQWLVKVGAIPAPVPSAAR